VEIRSDDFPSVARRLAESFGLAADVAERYRRVLVLWRYPARAFVKPRRKRAKEHKPRKVMRTLGPRRRAAHYGADAWADAATSTAALS
jgi:hypothetical protein